MRLHYRFFASLLDTLNIAACLYDERDNAVLWNQAFFRFFPEHQGHIHEGEPYRDNLLRFYRVRLTAAEMGDIDRYVSEGIARHRQQTRPFSFEHRGLWLRVSSLHMAAVGRLRIWVQVPPPRISPAGTEGALAKIIPSIEHPDVALLENMADGVTVIDCDGLIRSVNVHFLLLYGFATREAVLGHSMVELYRQAWQASGAMQLSPEESRQKGLALEEHLRFTGAPFELVLPDNRWIRIIVERNAEGMYYCIHTDITELKRRQQELERAESRARASEARYRLLADHLTDVVAGIDARRTVQYVSPSVASMLGVDPTEWIGKPWDTVLDADAGDRFSAWDDPARNRHDERYTFRIRHQDGTPRWIEMNVSVLPPQSEAQEIEFIFHLRDVSARKLVEQALERANAELAAQAMTDGLTGLDNRRSFDQTLATEWLRMRRDHDSVALLMIDIDYFKMLNDQCGHQVGDECLKHIATEIQKAARRPGDLAARYGGEEFTLLLPHTGRTDAMRIAQQLLLAVQELRIHPTGALQECLTVSIGVASCSPELSSTDASDLLRAADIALYKAKRNGRNRCEEAD